MKRVLIAFALLSGSAHAQLMDTMVDRDLVFVTPSELPTYRQITAQQALNPGQMGMSLVYRSGMGRGNHGGLTVVEGAPGDVGWSGGDVYITGGVPGAGAANNATIWIGAQPEWTRTIVFGGDTSQNIEIRARLDHDLTFRGVGGIQRFVQVMAPPAGVSGDSLTFRAAPGGSGNTTAGRMDILGGAGGDGPFSVGGSINITGGPGGIYGGHVFVAAGGNQSRVYIGRDYWNTPGQTTAVEIAPQAGTLVGFFGAPAAPRQSCGSGDLEARVAALEAGLRALGLFAP